MRPRNWHISEQRLGGACPQHEVDGYDKNFRHQRSQLTQTLKGSRISCHIERGLLVVGLLLMSTYGIALLHRFLASELAIRAVEAGPASPLGAGIVDFSLWSEKRMRAYNDSLVLMKGQPIAVLTLGRLGIKAPVFVGTDELALNRGVGWIVGTAKPGVPGNVGIAGHRDGFFRALKDVTAGDVVELKTPQTRLTYRVDEIEVVSPDNVGVLRSRNSAALTLVTCFPFYFVGDAPQRFIVHARLEGKVAINSVRNSSSSSI